ncbi:hypothetical protein WICPIJ_008397 [Wickerhamomyces pijperi]|uniref:Uncharacterized protein n=1 Tax=Wickerhamomyces pijperi TaxID=599730 RepID=A0A9P8PZE2_WICPI|nr:hypothetical protein WICPIJ_008397 [Wickerhamomyces pijperi]
MSIDMAVVSQVLGESQGLPHLFHGVVPSTIERIRQRGVGVIRPGQVINRDVFPKRDQPNHRVLWDQIQSGDDLLFQTVEVVLTKTQVHHKEENRRIDVSLGQDILHRGVCWLTLR